MKKMAIKKISLNKWKEMGLPTSSSYISPFFEWDRKKNTFKKPILVVTRKTKPKQNK